MVKLMTFTITSGMQKSPCELICPLNLFTFYYVLSSLVLSFQLEILCNKWKISQCGGDICMIDEFKWNKTSFILLCRNITSGFQIESLLAHYSKHLLHYCHDFIRMFHPKKKFCHYLPTYVPNLYKFLLFFHWTQMKALSSSKNGKQQQYSHLSLSNLSVISLCIIQILIQEDDRIFQIWVISSFNVMNRVCSMRSWKTTLFNSYTEQYWQIMGLCIVKSLIRFIQTHY